MFQRGVIAFLGIASVAFLGTFFYAVWLMGSPSGLTTRGQETRFLQIEEGAEFVRTFVYEDGLRANSIVSSVGQEWVGLTATQFTEDHPDWRVISFSPQRIVVEEACSDTSSGGFVRLEKDQVVVYTGQIDGCYRKQEALDVNLDNLSPFQSRELIAGIPFATEIDLSLILDGMSAP